MFKAKSFCFSVDGTPDGHKVAYGQPFQLATHDSLGKSVLLSSDNATFGKAAKKSRHQVVEFTDQNTFLTHWKAEHINPQLRLEFEQSPVPVSENSVFLKLANLDNLMSFGYRFIPSSSSNTAKQTRVWLWKRIIVLRK